jgi:hypothetical protein
MGPRLVRHLEGSEQAKERLEVILETLTGMLPVYEACDRLGIGEAMVHRLRTRVLQVAMADLEPRPRGRQRRRQSELERQCKEMAAQIEDLKSRLLAATIRNEVQEILRQPPPAKDALEGPLKKTTHNSRRRRRSRQPR